MYIRKFRIIILFSVLYFSISINSIAQQRDTSLNEVVISAILNRSTTRESTPVQIISKNKIEQMSYQNLSDAVKTMSGVSVKDYGGVGGVKTVSIRGLGSQHTAIAYDGITLSNAQNGQVDIGQFSLDNIEEVVLSIGLGDEIFQPARNFASSGVLNIKSSTPKFYNGSFNAGVQIKGGSFGYFNPSLSLQQRLSQNWSIAFNGDWMRSDGSYPFRLVNGNYVTTEKRNNSDVNVLRGELNIYGNIGRRGKLYIKGNILDSERGLPGSVIYYNNRSFERLWDRSAFVQGGYIVDLSNKFTLDTKLKYNYAWNKYTDQGNHYPNGGIDDRYTQNEFYASAALRYLYSKNLIFTFAQDAFINTLVSTIPENREPKRLTSMSSLAGAYSIERLNVTASLLYVHTSDKIIGDEKIADRNHLSPSISVSYKLLKDKNFRVRASFKESFRVPTFNELYFARVGNINLLSEKALQYNLGLTFSDKLFSGAIDYFSLSVDGYFNRVRDKIVAIPTLFIWKMLNMGRVNIAGGDVNVSMQFSLSTYFKVYLQGHYSYQYSVDLSIT